MRYGPGDLERYRRRLHSQSRYQRTHRDMQDEERIPERDDVAKVVLAMILGRCIQEPHTVKSFVEMTAERLTREKKRFDKEKSADVLRAMIEREREARDREARRRERERRR